MIILIGESEFLKIDKYLIPIAEILVIDTEFPDDGNTIHAVKITTREHTFVFYTEDADKLREFLTPSEVK